MQNIFHRKFWTIFWQLFILLKCKSIFIHTLITCIFLFTISLHIFNIKKYNDVKHPVQRVYVSSQLIKERRKFTSEIINFDNCNFCTKTDSSFFKSGATRFHEGFTRWDRCRYWCFFIDSKRIKNKILWSQKGKPDDISKHFAWLVYLYTTNDELREKQM